jgi:hypothetical protein
MKNIDFLLSIGKSALIKGAKHVDDFRRVPLIKDAIWKFYHRKNVTYDAGTTKEVQNMLYHLRHRSDVVDAWDGTFGILKKLKESGAPKKLIELAERQHEALEKVLDSL